MCKQGRVSTHSYRQWQVLRCFVLLSLLLPFIGCASSAQRTERPTATPPPIPSDLAIYIMLTAKYTAPHVIFSIHDMSADQAARILRALQAIRPPTDLNALHEQALNAYRHIIAGKLLLPGSDPVLRAEAYFMVDWGIGRLVDYREKLESLQQESAE